MRERLPDLPQGTESAGHLTQEYPFYLDSGGCKKPLAFCVCIYFSCTQLAKCVARVTTSIGILESLGMYNSMEQGPAVFCIAQLGLPRKSWRRNFLIYASGHKLESITQVYCFLRTIWHQEFGYGGVKMRHEQKAQLFPNPSFFFIITMIWNLSIFILRCNRPKNGIAGQNFKLGLETGLKLYFQTNVLYSNLNCFLCANYSPVTFLKKNYLQTF